MRPEKQYLVDEIDRYLETTEYVILADYSRLTVAETEGLRIELAKHGAQFHVIKNRIFRKVAEQREVRDLNGSLAGQTAMVFGGNDLQAVIKLLEKFYKDKEKAKIKGGVLGQQAISAEEVSRITELPSLEVLRAQLLGLLGNPASTLVRLLNTPAQEFVTVLGAPARDLLSVIQQKAQKDEA